MQIQNVSDTQALTKVVRTITGSALHWSGVSYFKHMEGISIFRLYYTHSAWLVLCIGNPQFELLVEAQRFFEAGAAKTNTKLL